MRTVVRRLARTMFVDALNQLGRRNRGFMLLARIHANASERVKPYIKRSVHKRYKCIFAGVMNKKVSNTDCRGPLELPKRVGEQMRWVIDFSKDRPRIRVLVRGEVKWAILGLRIEDILHYYRASILQSCWKEIRGRLEPGDRLRFSFIMYKCYKLPVLRIEGVSGVDGTVKW